MVGASIDMAFALAFLVALAVTALIVRFGGRHGHLNDHDLTGPQKMHVRAVPRVGGAAIFAGIACAVAVIARGHPGTSHEMTVLLACALPTFVAGLVEDVTKKVPPRWRLVITAVSAVLALCFLGAMIDRTDVAALDWLVVWPAEAAALTLFVVTGVTNAINLIDGFNGLASMSTVMILLGLAFVASRVGDDFIGVLALLTAAATMGFFLLNYPRGHIFLGDGGAYFLGFVLVELSVLLLQRHPRVSPMFPLLLCGYPIFETVFTMYRRRFLQRTATGLPDARHLHHLVYRRLTRASDVHQRARLNSRTSPYLWALGLVAIVPAVCFWDDTNALLIGVLSFMLVYVLAYWLLARSEASRGTVLVASSAPLPEAEHPGQVAGT